MIEIRSIQRAEAPGFLRLLCEVFELDYSRAEGIFFNEPMFDLKRKWALFDKGQMVSILTTVPLEFGWGPALGIAGVATKVERQKEGLAGRLLEAVLAESDRNGEGSAWLFAKEQSLYARCGFTVIDEVVQARLLGEVDDSLMEMLTFDEIQSSYLKWSLADPARLRRDERRWKYWKWNLRVCTPLADGYICHEGKQIRECVMTKPTKVWRFPQDSEWVGLKSMGEKLQLPLVDQKSELFLMGRKAPGVPQLFMTDQF